MGAQFMGLCRPQTESQQARHLKAPGKIGRQDRPRQGQFSLVMEGAALTGWFVPGEPSPQN